MPRRMIDPSILTSESIAALSMPAQAHFFRLLLLADDQGRFDARPRVVWRTAWPLSPAVTLRQSNAWTMEIAAQDILRLYEAGEKAYAYFPNWREYQKHGRMWPSKLPDPHADTSHINELISNNVTTLSRDGKHPDSDTGRLNGSLPSFLEGSPQWGSLNLPPLSPLPNLFTDPSRNPGGEYGVDENRQPPGWRQQSPDEELPFDDPGPEAAPIKEGPGADTPGSARPPQLVPPRSDARRLRPDAPGQADSLDVVFATDEALQGPTAAPGSKRRLFLPVGEIEEPEWLVVLREIPGWQPAHGDFSKLLAWAAKSGLSPPILLDAAEAMLSKLAYDVRRRRWNQGGRTYVNIPATFRQWAGIRRNGNGHIATGGPANGARLAAAPLATGLDELKRRWAAADAAKARLAEHDL